MLQPGIVGRLPRSAKHKTTTIREFDGGWNVVDEELSITPKYSRQLDNWMRSTDGSMQVRYGYELFADGSILSTDSYTRNITLATTTATTTLKIVIAGEIIPAAVGDALRFSDIGSLTTIGGRTDASLQNIAFPITDVNYTLAGATEITVSATGTNFSSTVAATASNGAVFTMPRAGISGDVVNATFFQGYLILVDTTGRIHRIDTDTKQVVTIWNQWGATAFASFFSFGGSLIVTNGVHKPVEVKSNLATDFLVDPATGSNSAIPSARFGISNRSFTILAGRSDKTAQLDISAKLTSGVYATNVDPDDAVDVDMSKVTNALDPKIMGIGELRDRLVVAFKDSISMGILGNYTTVGTDEIHEPDFDDQIAQHGTLSHRTIVGLGNDIFMLDRVGVPSIAMSTLSGMFVPERVSDLIEPPLQRNINRLSETTLANKTFAVFNARERQYMLFMPKFEEEAIELPKNPITFAESTGANRMIINIPSHDFEEGDQFTIGGSTNIGANLAASINTTWTVYSTDADYVFVEQDNDFLQTDITGGGDGVTVTPINDETLAYIYAHNPKQKVKAWSRYKGLDFDWGCTDTYGRLYFGKGKKIYRFGTSDYKLHADKLGDYDVIWAQSTVYTVGQNVLDSTTGFVYTVLEAHTSPASGTLADDVETNALRWEEWKGVAIKAVWEWPWMDFDKRMQMKRIAGIHIDTNGKAQFNLQAFVDLFYKDPLTGARTPIRSLDLVGAQSGGYGAGDQPYGAGRRTHDQNIWALPVPCKIAKLRFEAETTEPLSIVAVTMLYHEGSIKR